MTLVQSLEAAFEPEKYQDTYRENLLALIEAKVKGQDVVEAAPAQHKAPVIDILEALKMSLAEAKKPVRSVKESSTAPTEDESPEPKARAKRGS
jgi:DNA end-binding protein Ku